MRQYLHLVPDRLDSCNVQSPHETSPNLVNPSSMPLWHFVSVNSARGWKWHNMQLINRVMAQLIVCHQSRRLIRFGRRTLRIIETGFSTGRRHEFCSTHHSINLSHHSFILLPLRYYKQVHTCARIERNQFARSDLRGKFRTLASALRTKSCLVHSKG